jgi:hypothetical protein
MTNNITGRDSVIMRKALAYAIVAINQLPSEQREWSDMRDMRRLLDHLVGASAEGVEFYLDNAISHLNGYGFEK